ncbi:hypothetical protein C3L33_06488, partial [Rhododendron williamsianum]
GWEISFLIHSEYSLTEPYVAYVIPESLHCESAIFVENSMPVRDADMFGCNWEQCTNNIPVMLSLELPCHWIQVAGNRGASGIDGLLSTAIGFTVRCNKRVLEDPKTNCLIDKIALKSFIKHFVTFVIGDVSFLHDTNGLALLTQSRFIIAADNALALVSRFSTSDCMLAGSFLVGICKMVYSLYRIKLCAPPTSTSAPYDSMSCYREGLRSTQVSDSCHTTRKDQLLPASAKGLDFLLDMDQFRNIGSIFPSVRCGLEMAILNALAATEGSSLLNILHPETAIEELSQRSFSVQICALIDLDGTPKEVADIAATFVGEGFSAIKVARRQDPIEDARVIQEVRKRVGPQINLRADANQKWTYEEVVRFSSSCDELLNRLDISADVDCYFVVFMLLLLSLEPLQDEEEIVKFCEQTGLPVALDETIGNIRDNTLERLAKFTHPGVAAVVSPVWEGAAFLVLELQKEDICRTMENEPSPTIAHGLGTYRWLKEDITAEPLNIYCNPSSGFIEASIDDAACVLTKFQVNRKVILRSFTGEEVHRFWEVEDTLVLFFSYLFFFAYGPARKIRRAKDDSKSCALISQGLELFLDVWYAGELWNSLRVHPHFKKIVASRLQHNDINNLAKVLSDSSTRRQ